MIHPLHMQIDRNLDKNAAGVFILASCLCMKQPRVYKRWDLGQQPLPSVLLTVQMYFSIETKRNSFI